MNFRKINIMIFIFTCMSLSVAEGNGDLIVSGTTITNDLAISGLDCTGGTLTMDTLGIVSCSVQGSTGDNELRDADGNTYKTVIIGTQEWMAENLRTTKYNDGSNIPYVPNDDVWKQLDNGENAAYCWSNGDINNKFPYGALYNGYTVDTGKLCPTGWSIPGLAEWETLLTFLGTDPGYKMKTTGSLTGGDGLWGFTDGNTTNSSGFSSVPAGYRDNSNSSYSNVGINNMMWTSTENTSQNLLVKWTYMGDGDVYTSNFSKAKGYSVRCIKD